MKVGDKVYAGDWCEGIIDEIDGDTAIVEFTTFCGGVEDFHFRWKSFSQLSLIKTKFYPQNICNIVADLYVFMYFCCAF